MLAERTEDGSLEKSMGAILGCQSSQRLSNSHAFSLSERKGQLQSHLGVRIINQSQGRFHIQLSHEILRHDKTITAHSSIL